MFERKKTSSLSWDSESVSAAGIPVTFADESEEEEKEVSLCICAPGCTPVRSKMDTPAAILSLQQLVLLNAVVCGLEFCASAAFTYIPPMLLKSGMAEQNMSVVLGIGPLLGFIFVPVIGRASDRCRSSFGRRRPFILGLGLLLILALTIIPWGETLISYCLGSNAIAKGASVYLLIVGAVMLDFTSQVALTPCEALLSDACKNSQQEERGFMVYSFMVSLGGCIGYLITALDWTHSAVGIYLGGQERSAFSFLIVLFTCTLLATLAIAQESPNTNNNLVAPATTAPAVTLDITSRLDEIHQHLVKHKDLNGSVLPPQDPGYESDSNLSLSEDGVLIPASGDGIKRSPSPACPLLLIPEKTCHIPWTRWSVLNFQSFTHLVCMRLYHFLPSHFTTIFELPMVLRRLALANFFSWTAVMSFNLFYTDYVGQAIFSGNPNAPEDSVERALYDEGVRMGSWGLFFHCITSAIYAAFIERLTVKYGMRFTYFFGMISFSFAMFVMMMSRNLIVVNLTAALTGLGYATLTTIPFMLVNKYHENMEVYYFDVRRDPQHGIGADISSLDSAYFLSQVILSACMGYIVHLTGHVVTYLVVAGSMGALACACVSRIIISKPQLAQLMARNNRNQGGAATPVIVVGGGAGADAADNVEGGWGGRDAA